MYKSMTGIISIDNSNQATATESKQPPEAQLSVPPLPKEIRPIAAKMKANLQDLASHVVETYYKIGVLANEACDAFRLRSTYSMGVMEWLAAYLDVHPRVLYECRRFARRISEDDAQRLFVAPFNWTHVRTILGHGLDDQLDYWIKRVKTEKLSASALAAEVRRAKQPSEDRIGRVPAVPPSVPTALTQLSAAASKFSTTLENAMFGERFDLSAEVYDTSPDLLTDEVQQQYRDTVCALERIAHVAQENANNMREAFSWLDSVAQKRRVEEAKQSQNGKLASATALPKK